MRSELNDLGARLSALPRFEPPAAGWPAVLAARDARESSRDARWTRALAAVVLATTAGLLLWLQSAQRALSGDELAPVPADVLAEQMRAENRQLERLLAALPEPHALRGRTAFTVAELEDRLAFLDDRLSRVAAEPHAPERAEALWRLRTDVLHTLVQVRYADAIGTH